MSSSSGSWGADFALWIPDRLCTAIVLAISFWGVPASLCAAESVDRSERTAAATPASTSEDIATDYETVVRAASIPSEELREDVAASGSAITANRTPRSGETLPQLLSELPAVSVTRLGGFESLATVSLRGSAANQVLVYVDGVPQNSAAGGAVDLGALPLGEVERIEVYRGMIPIAFGATAMGGVVSLTTRTPRDTSLQADVGTGAFGTWFGGVHGSWATPKLRLGAGVHVLGSRGDFSYASDNGTAFDSSDDSVRKRTNNSATQFDGLVRAVVPLAGERRLSFSFSVFGRDQGLAGLGTYPTVASGLSTLRSTALLSYQSRDDFDLGIKLRALVYGTLANQYFYDRLGEIGPVPDETRDSSRTAGTNVFGTKVVAPWLKLSGILDGHYEGLVFDDVRNPERSGAPATRLTSAAGLEANWAVEALRLAIVPSARMEWSRDVVSGRNLFGAGRTVGLASTRALPVLRLALIEWPSESITLRANVAHYSRLPSTTELYGNSGTLLGNPQLVPESGLNGDVGGSLALTSGTVAAMIEAAAFGSLVADLIQFKQTPQGRARPDNIGRARVVGLEATAKIDVGAHVRLHAQGTFTDARDTSNAAAHREKQLPLRPRYRACARIEGRRISVGDNLQGGLYFDGNFASGNYVDPANLVAMPSRFVFGAGGYLELAPSHLRLVLSAQNLSDSRINDYVGFPLPGRALFATLAWSSTENPSSLEQTP